MVRATALQLQGDEPSLREAVLLTAQALALAPAGDDAAWIDAKTFSGKLHQLLGDFGAAAAAFEDALDATRLSRGQAHAETFAALARLAAVEEARGDVGGAERLYAEALDGLEASAGWADGHTYHAAASLCRMLQATDRLLDAERVLRRADAGLVASLGAADSRVQAHRVRLADVLIDRLEYVEARKVIDGVLDALDPRSPAYRVAMDTKQRLPDDEA